MGIFDRVTQGASNLYNKFVTGLTQRTPPPKPAAPVYGPTLPSARPAAPAPAPASSWKNYIVPAANLINRFAAPGSITRAVTAPGTNLSNPIATEAAKNIGAAKNVASSIGGATANAAKQVVPKVTQIVKDTVPNIPSIVGNAARNYLSQPAADVARGVLDPLGGAKKEAAKLVVQPALRAGVSAISEPLADAGIIKNSTVTPVSPLGKALLGSEPIQPLSKEIKDIKDTAEALGFTPTFSLIAAPFIGLGSKALDLDVGVGDILKGGAKNLLKHGVEDVINTSLRQEAERVLREGGEQAVKDFSQRTLAEVERRAGRALTEREIAAVENSLKRGLASRTTRAAEGDVARAVLPSPRAVAKVPAGAAARRGITEVISEIEQKLGRTVTPVEKAYLEKEIVGAAPTVSPKTTPKAPVEPGAVTPQVEKPGAVVPPNSPTAPKKVNGQLVLSEPTTPVVSSTVPANEVPTINSPVDTETKQVSDGYGKKDVITSPVGESKAVADNVLPAQTDVAQVTEGAGGGRGAGAAGPSQPSNTGNAAPVLDEVSKILNVPEPKGKGIIEKAKDFGAGVRSQLENQFYPIQRAESKLRKEAGSTLPEFHAARKMELQAGAQGKAEADLIGFEKTIIDPIKNHFDEFEQYLFLKRTEDRLINQEKERVARYEAVPRRYHGTSEAIGKLDNNYYSTMNIYGQGFYTTDDLNVARKYTKKGKGSSPTVYEVTPGKEAKLFDLDRPLSKNEKESLAPAFGEFSDLIIENSTIGEAIDELRANAGGFIDNLNADDVQDYIDNLRAVLEKDGYGGFRHTGGKLTKGAPHEVEIYWYPEGVGIKDVKQGLSEFSDIPSRAVGNFTVEKARQGLEELKNKVGPEVYQTFEQTGRVYQDVMDNALKLQVAAGRMDPKLYAAIKAKNDFYAPFHVLKYFDDVEHVAGTGKAIPNAADYTKKISGITSDEFTVGGILQNSADQVFKSRIMAEKTLRMKSIDALADIDPEGKFFKRVGANYSEKARPGYEIVHYFKDGARQGLEVPTDIARALGSFTPAQLDLVQKVLSVGRSSLRVGATTANLAFQPVNLFAADLPALALLSKYGLRNPLDVVRFPIDWMQGLFSSIRSNLGSPDQLFKDWMASGAANTSLQRSLTPDAFKRSVGIPQKTIRGKIGATAKSVISSPAKFANAIEEATKLTGFKRGLRIEGINMRDIEKLSPAAQEEALQRLVSEVRNYAGSPDFARSGSAKGANLLFMFFNARTQGVVRGLKRLGFQTGVKEGIGAWAKLSTAIGVPATALALYNLSPENREDYDAIPQYERDNYFMIPKGTYFTDDATGMQVRDYWRIPKREEVKLFANMIESGILSAVDHDAQAVAHFAQAFLENILPINIEGKDNTERAQSVIGSLNPLIKVPIEQTTNTDMFRHSEIVTDKYNSPADRTKEFTPTTPEELKTLANYAAKIFGKESDLASPLRLNSIIQGLTAGGITQFLDKKPEGDRGDYTTYPLLSRFVRGGTVNRDAFWDLVNNATAAKDTGQVEARQSVDTMLAGLKDGSISKEDFLRQVVEKEKTDPGYADRIKEALWEKSVGYTSEDKALKNFAIKDGARARLIVQVLGQMKTPEEKKAYLAALAKKKIVTIDVLKQILLLQKQNTTQ